MMLYRFEENMRRIFQAHWKKIFLGYPLSKILLKFHYV